MKKATQQLSVIAYFLSKYDVEAVKELGFSTQQKALSELSALFGHANAYLKMRRDEFDVVTGSHRQGFKNREPAVSVSKLTSLLDQYSFDELAAMVSEMIYTQKIALNGDEGESEAEEGITISENTIEDIMNGFNSDAQLVETVGKKYHRVYHAGSLEKLKKHYNYRCQICGCAAGEEYDVSLAEVHHIIPFSVSQDNSLANLVVLCPNHHRLLHKLDASFDTENACFMLSDSRILHLKVNDHL